MPVNHLFISTKPDDADATLVRPSNWNAALVGTLDLSNISNSTTDIAVTGTLPAANIGGLTTANFTSTNISQWTNDAGYITESDIDYSAITITRDGNNLATLVTYAGPETITPTRDGDGFITSFVDTRYSQTVTITRNADGFATSTTVS